jgi:hypothetical protein
LSDPIARAHILGTTVWDFIADRHAGKGEAYAESLRGAANGLLFDEAARKSDAPIVKEGNRLAHAERTASQTILVNADHPSDAGNIN